MCLCGDDETSVYDRLRQPDGPVVAVPAMDHKESANMGELSDGDVTAVCRSLGGGA